MAKTKVIKRVEPKAPAPIEAAPAHPGVHRLQQSLKQCAHYRDNAKARGNATATHYWETKVETIKADIARLEGGAV